MRVFCVIPVRRDSPPMCDSRRLASGVSVADTPSRSKLPARARSRDVAALRTSHPGLDLARACCGLAGGRGVSGRILQLVALSSSTGVLTVGAMAAWHFARSTRLVTTVPRRVDSSPATGATTLAADNAWRGAGCALRLRLATSAINLERRSTTGATGVLPAAVNTMAHYRRSAGLAVRLGGRIPICATWRGRTPRSVDARLAGGSARGRPRRSANRHLERVLGFDGCFGMCPRVDLVLPRGVIHYSVQLSAAAGQRSDAVDARLAMAFAESRSDARTSARA